MNKNRLEAFSDGVIAVIITIMVLELKAPHMNSLPALLHLWPVFFAYVLSFLSVAIYWVHHHHLFHLASKVTTGTLWANLNLLFWLSLFPSVTDYLGETRGAPLAASLYATVAFCCGLSSNILRRFVAKEAPQDETERKLHSKRNLRSVMVLSCYFLAILAAWIWVPASIFLVVLPMLRFLFADSIFPEHRSRGS
jgi:uncharacterized membrane protein